MINNRIHVYVNFNIIPVPYQEIKLSDCQFRGYQIFFLVNFSYLSCWQLFNNHWHTIRILSSDFLSWKLTSIFNISLLKCKESTGSYKIQYIWNNYLPLFFFQKDFLSDIATSSWDLTREIDFIPSFPAGVDSPNILGSSEKNNLTYQHLRK